MFDKIMLNLILLENNVMFSIIWPVFSEGIDIGKLSNILLW